MMKKYDVRITATIEIGGVFEAENVTAAVEAAKMELRLNGTMENLVVERAIYLDDEE